MDILDLNTKGANLYASNGFKGKHCVAHVLDTGSAQVGRNKLYVTGDTYDTNGHGTFVASQIDAAATDIQIIAHKIIPGDEALMTSALQQVYEYAQSNKDIFNIVNMSCTIRSPKFLPAIVTLENMVDKLVSYNIPIVCAAGNDNNDGVNLFPATFQSPFCITAMKADGTRAPFSNFPNESDFVELGFNCTGLSLSGTNTMMDGTSMATPIVLWKLVDLACEFMFYNHRWPTDPELYEIAKGKVIDMGVAGIDPYFGWGYIDLSKLTVYKQPTTTEPPKEINTMKSFNAVATGSVNIRAGASTDTKVLGVANQGLPLLVLDAVNGWRQVSTFVGGKFIQGYVSDKYVKVM